MKRIIAFAAVLVFLTGIPVPAQEDEREEESGVHRFLNLSLYYPVSLNRSPYDRVNMNLSLACGRVGSVSGLDLSLAGSLVNDHLTGVQVCGLAGVIGKKGQGIQLSGLASVCGESFTGLQASGLITVAGEKIHGFQTAGLINVAGGKARWFQGSGLANIAGEEFEGGQFAGLFNIAGENAKGIQATGFFNIAGENMLGIQTSGLFNIAGESMQGIQVSGLFNIVGEEFQGGQISGLFNLAGEKLHGVQIAPLNAASRSSGIQIGLVNIGETSDGVQVGLVNYIKREHNGLPLGVVNLAENGALSGVLWASGGVAISGGMKFTVGRWHSVASLGFGNLDDNLAESLTWGVHYGTTFPAGNVAFQPEIGYRYRDNYGLFKSKAAEPDQHILEARLLLKVPLSRRAALLLGGGWQRVFDEGPEDRSGRSSPLFAAGLELF